MSKGNKFDFTRQYKNNPGVGEYQLPSIWSKYWPGYIFLSSIELIIHSSIYFTTHPHLPIGRSFISMRIHQSARPPHSSACQKYDVVVIDFLRALNPSRPASSLASSLASPPSSPSPAASSQHSHSYSWTEKSPSSCLERAVSGSRDQIFPIENHQGENSWNSPPPKNSTPLWANPSRQSDTPYVS